MSYYKLSDQLWLSDSLNWEKIIVYVTSDWTILSFLFQSSFINHHIFLDYISKLSYIDIFLVNSNLNTFQILYYSLMNDFALELLIILLPINNIFQTEYQDICTTLLLLTPELNILLNEYALYYYTTNIINYTPIAVFDSYTNNMNYYYSEGIIYFMMFWLYVWFIIYFFTIVILLKWSNFLNIHFVRFYYYFFNISKETRIQFEAVLQSMLFFLFY